MSKKKILMQRFNGTGYDPQYPETHVKNVTGINQTVANNVGVNTTDGATVIGEMSEIDYFVSPQGTTTGTSTAYNLNIGSQYTSLDDMDGVVIRAKFHTTTGDNPTLNVNGLGAKPILAENGANIPYQIGENVWATLIWSRTLNGWIVQGWGKKLVFHKEIITKTTNWTVPEGIEGGIVNVMLFGGGGGGGGTNRQTDSSADITYFGYGGGGGGGYCSLNKIVKLTAKQIIPITIGAGGTAPTGPWYSRSNGGNGGTTSFGTYVSAAGGEGGRAGSAGTSESHGGTGGSGGSGGGGGSASYGSPRDYGMPGGAGGNGAQFGGGGGGYKAKAGNGGTYGGGGGAGHHGTAGTGGQYGGNGGAPGKAGNAGTNTTSIADIDFKGEGKGGSSGSFAGGGGGGYGGNGGKASGSDYYCSGGGGGGYGGNGGSGDIYSGGGGGGGYGGVGGDTGGGGGGYGANNYGAGGDEDKAGKSGICILTYWSRDEQ